MKVQEIVRRVFEALEVTSIPYVLVGSFASNIYGIVRSTKDADFVIRVAPGEFKNLMDALGPGFVRDPQIQFETVTGTKKYLVSEPESGFEIEFFELSDDPHDQQRFVRRRKLTVLDHDAWVLTPEDVLVTKLNWLHRANRGKDLLDVENVISVQADALDWRYIESWCDAHGSRPLLEKIRAELATRRQR
jgi:hypothetical protein